ncbi:MAG: ATP-binding cassette domain-containing protein [Alphaproteobacteria bacterium]
MTKSENIKIHNPIYQTIQSAEFLLPPIAAATTGFIHLGLTGFVGGAALGTVDAIAIYYKFYDKPYLTSGTLGFGCIHLIPSPSFSILGKAIFTVDLFGFTLGSLLPTGIFNDHLHKMITPISSSIWGYSYAGPVGAAVGLAAGIIDEGLEHYNITDQHYLTSLGKDIAISNLLLTRIADMITTDIGNLVNNPYVKESIGAFYTAYKAYHDSDKEQKKKKLVWLELKDEIYDLYEDIILIDQLEDLIQNQVLAVVSSQLAMRQILLALAVHSQNFVHDLESFDTDRVNSWTNMKIHFVQIMLFVPFYCANNAIANLINQYFRTKLTYIVEDSLTNEFMSGEIPLKIANYQVVNGTDSNTLIKNLADDIVTVSDKGSKLLTESFSSIIQGFYGVSYLFNINAINALLYSYIYNEAINYVSNITSTKTSELEPHIKEMKSKITSIDEHIRVNADSVIQGKKINFSRDKRQKIKDELRKAQELQGLWEIVDSGWTLFREITNSFTNELIIGYELFRGMLEFEQRFKVYFMVEGISNMFGWEGKNAGSMNTVRMSIGRLNELKELMRVENFKEHKVKYFYEQSDKVKICFNTLTIGVANRTLFQVDDTCIDDSNAITGKEGAGKSSHAKIIAQIKEDKVWGEGSITYYTLNGKKVEVYMISQRDNLLPYCTLSELITLRTGKSDHEEKIKELMKEVEIDSNAEQGGTSGLISYLNEEKIWDKHLSGGQKKKLYIISIIYQILYNDLKLDVIIFDEIFDAISSPSIEKLQNVIKKYMSDILILSIDHRAAYNNYNDFYKHALHVKDGVMSLKDVEKEPIIDNFMSTCRTMLDTNEKEVITDQKYIDIIDFCQNLLDGDLHDMNAVQ